MNTTKMNLIGYASGIGANNVDCALGPWYLYYHPELFVEHGLDVVWHGIVQATSNQRGMDVLSLVQEKSLELGRLVSFFAKKSLPFCVLGGDHSSAMGTWSAVAAAYRPTGDVGLIWIDAHMDSHTPETSESKNIHGMPLAHLLGKGDVSLIQLFESNPALRPENVCLVGARSYESGEQEILRSLGVKILKMEEVIQIGIAKALDIALNHVTRHTIGFGISLDLDGIDPLDAPGVGCPEPNGIPARALLDALHQNPAFKNHLGLEIVEYNPIRDINHQTAKLAMELLHALCK